MQKQAFALLAALLSLAPLSAQSPPEPPATAQSLPPPPPPPLPSAEKVLKNVADAYRAPQRYLFAGKGIIQGPATPNAQPIPFTLAIEMPDKIHLEGDTKAIGVTAFAGPVLFVSDGDIASLTEPAVRKYYQAKRTSPKQAVGKFENRYPALDRPEQFVAYLDHFVTARYSALAEAVPYAKVTKTEKLLIQGKFVTCYVVQIDRGAFEEKRLMSSRQTLWVDTHRSLVWREDNLQWLSKQQQQHSRTDLSSILLNEPLPAETFTFKPPTGFDLAPLPARK
jgi:outer membrane lipoprotein-sorting protein